MKKVLRFSIVAIFSCLITGQIFAQASDQKTDGDGVSDKDLKVFIPNAFTPNSDGLNDVFKPSISGPELKVYEIRILDRNGGEVFYSTDPSRVWNGSVNGDSFVPSPSIFIYFLRVQSVEDISPKTYQGHVALIR